MITGIRSIISCFGLISIRVFGLTLALFGCAHMAHSLAMAEPSLLFSNENPPAKVEILKGWRQHHHEDSHHVFALKIVLAEGWKTYWRLVGDDGIAPHITWTLLANASTPEIHYPNPTLIVDPDAAISIIGYRDEVVFPIIVDVPNPNAPVRVAGLFEFGICDDICIPEQIQFRAELGAELSIWVDEIIRVLDNKMVTVVRPFDCRLRPSEDHHFILDGQIKTDFRPPLAIAALPDYLHPHVEFSDIKSSLSDDGTVRLQARIDSSEASILGIERSKIKIVVVTENQAIEYTGCGSDG